MQSQLFQLNDIDEELLELALKEDLSSPYLDVTTIALFHNAKKDYAVKIVSKDKKDIVISGIPIIHALLKKIHADYEIKTTFQDGDILKPSETLLTIHSDANSILMLERTLLNFLRHLCAIATLTHQFVNKAKHTSIKILDTRKTSPGQRHLEKYAVACGGGVNHRMGLYDAYMVKDTHIDLIGGMQQALKQLPDKSQNHLPVIIEVRDLQELQTVIDLGQNKVTRVLLDNMSLETLKQGVLLCKDIYETECSGNVNLDTIVSIAEAGVDFASIGMLTYGAGQVDLSMKGLQNS